MPNTLLDTAIGDVKSDQLKSVGTVAGGTVGFNGKTPIPAAAAPTPVTLTPPTAVTVTTAFGFQTAGQAQALITAVNALITYFTNRGDLT